MQQRRHDRRAVQPLFAQQAGYFDRMRKIRVSRRTDLVTMRLHGEDIRPVQRIFVDIGVILAHPFDQFVLPHHRGSTIRSFVSFATIAKRAASESGPFA